MNRKRTSTNFVDIQSLKQSRMEETSISMIAPAPLVNGSSTTTIRPVSPIILNGMKLVTNTVASATAATSLIDGSTDNARPIELAPTK